MAERDVKNVNKQIASAKSQSSICDAEMNVHNTQLKVPKARSLTVLVRRVVMGEGGKSVTRSDTPYGRSLERTNTSKESLNGTVILVQFTNEDLNIKVGKQNIGR